MAQLAGAYARRKQFEAKLLANEMARVLAGDGKAKPSGAGQRGARPVTAAEFLRVSGAQF